MHMYGQTVGVCEPAFAETAGIRTFASVYADVPLQRRGIGKCFRADEARVRSFPGMCSSVNREVMELSERPLTYVTDMRSFTGVTTDVTSHRLRPLILRIAHLAYIVVLGFVVSYDGLPA